MLSLLVLASLYRSHVSLPPINDDHNMKTHHVRNLRAASASFTRMQKQKIRQQIPEDKTARAIFYNIFIPTPSEDGTTKRLDNALDIVSEQLNRKSVSRYANQAPIYYTLIGHNTTDEIQKNCGESQCHLSHYGKEGDESLTLQSLWEYCQENPSSVVTYIHNKGSFHPSDRNTRLRTMVTKSVFSDQCQTISTTDDDDNRKHPKCNACSARFSPFPHWHMPGNMWTAQCSYVRNLHAPREFESKMKAMVDSTVENTDPSAPRPSNAMIRAEYLVGLGRYSMEHWLGSHPDLRPCDVYDDGMYRNSYSYLPSKRDRWKPRLQEAPWSNADSYLKFIASSDSPREWFCGQARLLEFALLYDNKAPSADSFFWSYYADVSAKYCPIPLTTQKLAVHE
jgi:hypothetical protein